MDILIPLAYLAIGLALACLSGTSRYSMTPTPDDDED